MGISNEPLMISLKAKRRARAAFHKPSTGECTCEDGGREEELKCPLRWYCCDCGREMMHRYGDLLGRCWQCNCELDAKL
jgi:hypothetical protein